MKIVQFQLFITAGLCIFVISVILWLGLFTSNINTALVVDEIQTYRILEPKVIYNPKNDTLVNLHDFKYIMNNVSLCMNSMKAQDGSRSAIAIIVHSARNHFDRRYAIRNTWGSVKKLKGWHLHLTFLLGIDPNSDPELESELWDESREHGDIIMGNFVDSYKNLTYKHLMGYKWVTTFCPSAKFILKTDDDIYADIFQVVEILLVELLASKKTYICENMIGNVTSRNENYKWYLSKDDFAEDAYPAFCSGSAYLMTADGAQKIYTASNKTKFIWIDDVFVTGILRENYDLLVNNSTNSSLEILSIYGQHHLHEITDIIEWCKRGLPTDQLLCTFILIENDVEFLRDMFCIWNRIRLLRFAMSNGIDSATN